MPEGIAEEFPRFRPSGAVLMTMDEAYEAKRSRFRRGETVDLWMVGVPPGSRRAGRRPIGGTSGLLRGSTALELSEG